MNEIRTEDDTYDSAKYGVLQKKKLDFSSDKTNTTG
jgi:hypothetical protein